MRPDDGGVDHDVFKVRIVGHRRKQPIPNAVLALQLHFSFNMCVLRYGLMSTPED
jgi:hypothetical protein